MTQVAEKIKSAYDILVEASEGAEQAVRDCTPRAIIVGEAIGLSNEIDESKPTYCSQSSPGVGYACKVY